MEEKNSKEESNQETEKTHGSFIEVNFKELDALLQFKVSKSFVADYLGVSEDTIDRRIKEKFNMTFTQYKALRSGTMSIKLQQKAIQMAVAGDKTMLKFALKNMSGWTESVEEKNQSQEIVINIDEDDSEL